MRIRLTEEDYFTIYPLAKPTEIQEEFGEHSHCVSQIRNKYSKLRFPTQAKALRALKDETLRFKPSGVSTDSWKRSVNRELEEKKRAAFDEVHERLKTRRAFASRMFSEAANGE